MITRTCDGPECNGKAANIRIHVSIVDIMDADIDACCHECALTSIATKLAEYPESEE